MINISKLAAVARAKPKATAVPASSTKAEQEMMSRRAALRRIGMTGGIAVLGLLTIDDLARVASQKLEQNELTRGIAKDFKSAGVAFADTVENGGGYDEEEYGGGKPKPIPIPPNCKTPNQDGNVANCTDCLAAYYADCKEKASEKYSGFWNWVPRTNAHEACRVAGQACKTLCTADDSAGAVDTFAKCYQKGTSEI